ncbi:hypothetical protein HU200_002111 [Digitaria exilis]|uniref:Uncharacterized protein n=1 Tax=Digitaria exilis TaxID=1010633 RepID=A0A835FZW5_9POAL|nr:hypothetical protein HU200_002111 [Digitaria exilis]
MLHRRSRTLGGSSDRAARRAATATIKGGRGSNGATADLLVCFPSRAHLALMPPKAICSPSRPSASEPVKRRHSTSRAGPLPPSGLYKSSTARNPSRRRAADAPVAVDEEPSSPKVTCVGQIKAARPAAKAPKGLAGDAGKKATKKPTWLQALGIKKDAMALLDALHGAFRFNVAGCFGSFPGAVGVGGYTSGEDDDDEEEEGEERAEKETEHGAALARWFMVLEEGNNKVPAKKLPQQNKEEDEEQDAAPPANALMLMRCRSAPAKGLVRRLEAEDCEDDVKSAKKTPEEEKEKESLVLMTYSPDFFKVSLDIAKETWIVGGDDAVLRCRSWKR